MPITCITRSKYRPEHSIFSTWLSLLCFGLTLFFFLSATHAEEKNLCTDYYQITNATTSNGITLITVNPIEDRVLDAISCLHQLRQNLHTAQKNKDRDTIKIIEHELSDVEEDLRNIGKRLDRIITSRCYCVGKRDDYEARLADIRHYFHRPRYERLYIGHNDYDRYFFKLNIGYEYNSISTILEESSPRLGLLINNHFGRRPYQDEYGAGLYGVQLSGNLILSGASEQSSTAPGSTENLKTLSADISAFAPLIRSKIRPDLALQAGMIMSVSASQTDASTGIRWRKYIGVRSGLSPLHYLDVLIGRSPGLKSTRLELRAQMPVANIGKGSRFYLGAIANMAIYNDQPDEEDIVTVYFTWNIDFLNLFVTGG